ncbi:MAG TPA: ComF family protein [Candidatus Acidoferrum sp.]|nr:ComF family protein [Candidatus Acidoferrum sp.]
MIAFLQPAQRWLNTGLGFLYPEICRLCESERATPADGYVGPRCWQRVRFIKPPFCARCGLPFEGDLTTPFECTNCSALELPFRFARSAVVARGVVLEAIHRFKYQRQMWFENFLAGLFLREAVPALRDEPWDVIVPVPLHPLKQREREFNQAARLATHLAAALKVPLNPRLLRRVNPTATQTRLTRTERAANMRGAFALRPGEHLDGERVILVDDVFTTGATTGACARVLLAAGATDVCVWTVARGL